MRPSNFLVSHTWYTIWISFARKFQLSLTFSDALYVIWCGILSAGQMIFHAHVLSAVLMQFYIAGLGCDFGVHFLHVESIIALHITFPR